jgi:hypothetical protein
MKIILRIITDIIIFVAILNGWWIIALPLAMFGAWFFRYFIEIILAGMAYDALFNMIQGSGWKGYIGTIIAVILFLIAHFLKKSVRSAR